MVCSHLAHLWASSDSAPRSKAVGIPLGGKGYVATLPTCGPPPILPPALKPSGCPRRQGLCSHLAHSWATCDSAPLTEAWASPRWQGLCSHLAHLCATSNVVPRSKVVGIPQWQGLCSQLTHLCATGER